MQGAARSLSAARRRSQRARRRQLWSTSAGSHYDMFRRYTTRYGPVTETRWRARAGRTHQRADTVWNHELPASFDRDARA
eukprot:7550655-Pyramimonas_sp.AAC.2